MTTHASMQTPQSHRETLMDDFTLSPLSLGDLARTHRMTIPALAKWAGAPLNRRVLDAIRDLSNTRTDLIVALSRMEAAHHLRRLASESASAETQRKSCVDLLRLGLAPGPVRGRSAKGGGPEAGAEGPVDAEAARRLLESLVRVGEEAEGAAASGEAGAASDGPTEHAA
jgi:hypothetical protein